MKKNNFALLMQAEMPMDVHRMVIKGWLGKDELKKMGKDDMWLRPWMKRGCKLYWYLGKNVPAWGTCAKAQQWNHGKYIQEIASSSVKWEWSDPVLV